MARILVIDDSNLARRMMRSILEPAGHEVLDEKDGLAALERYFLVKPDLVLLDLNMSGMTGFEILQKLRQMDERAKVIVGTADIQRSTREMVEQAGAAGYVTKPFVEADVLAAVASVLEEGNHDTDA